MRLSPEDRRPPVCFSAPFPPRLWQAGCAPEANSGPDPSSFHPPSVAREPNPVNTWGCRNWRGGLQFERPSCLLPIPLPVRHSTSWKPSIWTDDLRVQRKFMQRLLPRAEVSGRKGFGQGCSKPFSILAHGLCFNRGIPLPSKQAQPVSGSRPHRGPPARCAPCR